MTFRTLFAAAALSGLAGCGGETPQDAAPQNAAPSPDAADASGEADRGVIAGGYAPADPDDPAFADARGRALDAVRARYSTEAEVAETELELQVVAGLNLRFRFELTDGEVYAATVHEDLAGGVEVTDVSQIE